MTNTSGDWVHVFFLTHLPIMTSFLKVSEITQEAKEVRRGRRRVATLGTESVACELIGTAILMDSRITPGLYHSGASPEINIHQLGRT